MSALFSQRSRQLTLRYQMTAKLEGIFMEANYAFAKHGFALKVHDRWHCTLISINEVEMCAHLQIRSISLAHGRVSADCLRTVWTV